MTPDLDRQVDVWFVRLAASDLMLARARGILSADERARAGRFFFEHLQRRYTLARAALRVLAGRHLSRAPESLPIAYAGHGKPRLPDSRLQFNLSHSGDLAAYAFSNDVEVGIDIEQIRPVSDRRSIARRFFSARECRALEEEEPAGGDAAFFRCWTRKEAYIKAIGAGLSVPLAGFSVSLEPGPGAALTWVDGRNDEHLTWTLADLAPAPGYAGALAFRDRRREIRIHPLTDAGGIL